MLAADPQLHCPSRAAVDRCRLFCAVVYTSLVTLAVQVSHTSMAVVLLSAWVTWVDSITAFDVCAVCQACRTAQIEVSMQLIVTMCFTVCQSAHTHIGAGDACFLHEAIDWQLITEFCP